MKNIFIIVEGQTEEQFFGKNLQQHYVDKIGNYRYYFQVVVMPTKRNQYAKIYKGGSINFENCIANIKRFLAQTKHCKLVLLVLDYYGLHRSFKTHLNKTHTSLAERVISIQERLEQKIDNPRFKFRLQVHEFEALLFSDVRRISQHFNNEASLSHLEQILSEFKNNPELINDSPKTAPSKRLVKIYPKFRKTTDGLQIIGKIPILLLREKCTHFDDLCKLIDNL